MSSISDRNVPSNLKNSGSFPENCDFVHNARIVYRLSQTDDTVKVQIL